MSNEGPTSPTPTTPPPRIAVLVPCYNEELTVGKVVDDFRAALPEAEIYVFDNCSQDATARIAAEHGAIVVPEPRQGKGNVVEAMFSQVDADYYVMVDGDDTYDASSVRRLLEPVQCGAADMAVATRLGEFESGSFRALHVGGNKLVRGLINRIFGVRLNDILSGYRAFNRLVVERVPVVCTGFEIETEMTIQMLYYGLKIVEVPTPYRTRPDGSFSKLNTFSDGFRVLWKLFSLARAIKPLTFFGLIALLLAACGLLAGAPPVIEFIQTGKVLRFPLAILATGLMILSGGCVFLGILLHALNWRFKELHNLISRTSARHDRLRPGDGGFNRDND